MSIWEWACAVDGYVQAHGSDSDKRLSAKEQDELANWMGI